MFEYEGMVTKALFFVSAVYTSHWIRMNKEVM